MNMHSLEDLEALARQFNTDKQAGQNGYLALYLEYFKRHGIERDAPISLLEIGTNKGSSLRMWAEYFQNARVYGLDITREYELPGMLEHDRIRTEIADQGDPSEVYQALLKLGSGEWPTFDVVIDDGSHEQSDQQISLGVLFYYLKPGGLYIIEDLITGENWWDANTYNKARVIPTRDIMQQLEAGTEITKVDVIPEDEWDFLLASLDYCEYRESDEIIYSIHHPQLAFLGRKS